MATDAQVEAIMKFVNETQFTGYQRLALPNGHVIPGQDGRPLADLIFPERLDGKTVLDIGCYYGYFLHNAVERGAARAVGIEQDAGRVHIAQTIAPLWDGKVEVRLADVQTEDLGETFDYVLLLKVLHHLIDPIAVVKRLASLCRGTMIIEFREPWDPQFMLHATLGRLEYASPFQRVWMRVRSGLHRWLTDDIPLVGVGSTPYHRVYYPNRKAFRNLFVVQHEIFKEVRFERSPGGRSDGIVAFCEVTGSTRQAKS